MGFSAAAAIAAAVISAAGTIQQGRAAKQQADFQAQVQNQQAQRELQIAATQEEDARRDHSRAMAQRRAVLGGSGIEFATGSPLLVGQDLEGDAELQALRIRSGGEARSTSLRQDALLTRARGKADRTASFFTAGSKLASATGTTFRAIEKNRTKQTDRTRN